MKNNYLLECSDSTLVEEEISKLIKKNDFQDALISSYDLEETSLDNALEDLDTYSLLSDKKVIIIKNLLYDNKNKLFSNLLKYLDNYNPSNLLFICDKKLNNTLKIVKDIKNNKNTEYIKIEVDVYKYTEKLLKGYSFSKEVIDEIVSLCKDDITRITNECEKLTLFKNNDKKITINDVKLLVIEKLGESSDKLFSLVNYIISKDKKNALNTLKAIKEYNIDANSIIGLMSNQIRLIHQIKVLNEYGYSNKEIADRLNLKSIYQVKKVKENIYNYTYKEIYNFVEELSNMDLNIKSGKIDSDIAVDMLIINL